MGCKESDMTGQLTKSQTTYKESDMTGQVTVLKRNPSHPIHRNQDGCV